MITQSTVEAHSQCPSCGKHALGMAETAVRVAVHPLRKRYRDLLRARIADTLSDPAQVEEELRSLHAALGH